MKKKIIFTGIGYNLLETIKYFLNYKQVEVSAVIPLNNYPNSKKFYQNLKKLQKQSFFKILIFDQINSLNCVNKLKKISPDLICNWGHNQLFKKKILDIPKIGCLNIHPGLLPYGRGSGAIQGEIINKTKQIGWSTHFMDENFDTGELVKVRRFSICSKNETALSLERKSQKEMLLLFREIIDQYESQQILYSKPQDSNKMRYLNYEEFKKLKNIPLNSSSEYADKISRAFWYPPYDLAYYKLPNGTNIEVIPEIAKDEVAKSLHQDDYIISDLILNGRIPNLNKNY